MQKDYYQNILYPIQDKVLNIVGSLPVDFYLSGGTALSRVHLNHRFSDDLDFFLNYSKNFGKQVQSIVDSFKEKQFNFEIPVVDSGFVRLFINFDDAILKIDFINDVPYRIGVPLNTDLYKLTDTVENILSNKISALPRCEPKDIVDIVFIANKYKLDWQFIFAETNKKDIWINPIETANIMDKFDAKLLNEIHWIGKPPDKDLFMNDLEKVIKDVLVPK